MVWLGSRPGEEEDEVRILEVQCRFGVCVDSHVFGSAEVDGRGNAHEGGTYGGCGIETFHVDRRNQACCESELKGSSLR